MYAEHEMVILCRDLPELRLLAGDVGTVVGAYRAGGYEVEFSGATLAIVTLGEEDLRRREAHEIFHVRPVLEAAG